MCEGGGIPGRCEGGGIAGRCEGGGIPGRYEGGGIPSRCEGGGIPSSVQRPVATSQVCSHETESKKGMEANMEPTYRGTDHSCCAKGSCQESPAAWPPSRPYGLHCTTALQLHPQRSREVHAAALLLSCDEYLHDNQHQLDCIAPLLERWLRSTTLQHPACKVF